MKQMVYAGIVAGGTGTRMGADRPKQYLEIKGETILVRTVRRFLEAEGVDRIYIAVHPEWIGYCEGLLDERLGADERVGVRVVAGGADRNASVFSIISAILAENEVSDDDILLTHDAVRPFVSGEVIAENIRCAAEHTVCTTAVAAVDTILYSEHGVVTETPDRSKLYHAQTPQSFKINAILGAYAKLDDGQRAALTDVCGIFTAAGQDVHIVKGDAANIKITAPFDLVIAEAILGQQG